MGKFITGLSIHPPPSTSQPPPPSCSPQLPKAPKPQLARVCRPRTQLPAPHWALIWASFPSASLLHGLGGRSLKTELVLDSNTSGGGSILWTVLEKSLWQSEGKFDTEEF